MLSCFLNIDPKDRLKPHILVINSISPLGSALVEKLREKGIKFAEIRGRGHFDFLQAPIFDILSSIRVDIAFNFEDPTNAAVQKAIESYFLNSTTYVISASPSSFGHSRIQIPDAFAYTASKRSNSERENWLFESEIGSKLTPPSSPSGIFIYASDVTNYLESLITSIRAGVVLSPVLKPRISAHTNSELFKYFSQLKAKIPASPIYLSYVISVSDSHRIVTAFNRTLEAFSAILSDYPHLPFEIVCVFAPSHNSTQGILSLFSIPHLLHQYFRLIELPFSEVQAIKKKNQIEYFPEFHSKNIGVRRSRGEYIITANADSIPPPQFFDAILYQQLSPLTYFRTNRKHLKNPTVDAILDFFKKNQSLAQEIWSKPCEDEYFYHQHQMNACGDFQGGHRMMWANIKGFVQTGEVFHVDTVLGMDFSTQPCNMLVRVFPQNVHQKHIKSSTLTKRFRFYNSSYKSNVKAGLPSFTLETGKRDDWGSPHLDPEVTM